MHTNYNQAITYAEAAEQCTNNAASIMFASVTAGPPISPAAATATASDALAYLAEARSNCDAAIISAVRAIRDGAQPQSWALIGTALGMSRQAAWERYEGGPLHTDLI